MVRASKPPLPCDDPAVWRQHALANAQRGTAILVAGTNDQDADDLLLAALQQLRLAMSVTATATPP